ncbi:MAG: hypothetical protein F6K55_18590 [Moorea sp. SIO4A3]|nr:hypothetical protein [Moorena sp. SIO4A3]
MALITINDIQESESFLTELKDTDLAMDLINGGSRRGRRRRRGRLFPFGGFFFGLFLGALFS